MLHRLRLSKPSPITDESTYLNRRAILQSLVALAAGGATAAEADWFGSEKKAKTPDDGRAKLLFKADKTGAGLKQTEELAAISYNNFYEFGLDKADPAKNAQAFKTKPWSVVIDGEVAKPGRYSLEDMVNFNQLEERIYRMRCVEAWSMVIPWLGVPLASLLKRVEPTSKAKFVAFETLVDPAQMPGQKPGWLGFASLDWPYREGLRMDEAMHPLTLLAVGMYGKVLPPQNGAPLRLVVPWKYGFKGIKSIVRISLVEHMPKTSWNLSAPNEYGFYANVNPSVSHPRWSQAKERRIYSGNLGGVERINTEPFNGYADQVASLYSSLDLRRNF